MLQFLEARDLPSIHPVYVVLKRMHWCACLPEGPSLRSHQSSSELSFRVPSMPMIEEGVCRAVPGEWGLAFESLLLDGSLG